MVWKRRESKREWVRSVALICFSMAVLLMSWEGQKTNAAIAQTSIPKDSIRLRILANSDLPEDQLVKRHVRDAVVEQMNAWVKTLDHPQSLDEARQVIRAKLPEIEDEVGQTLRENGKSYGYHVELGVVPFPTKMYGGAVYPAGDYEAVRVTLGAGSGQNWWCVLFPPLCFIDAGTGDAVAKNGAEVKTASAATSDTQKDAKAPEVRFFLWDFLCTIFQWIGNLFA
ncbi:stage II sporulation protein R [Paenibacillus shirakamiensis]|uniref:Stage II sporulation protein R n=1 Tax=Paenibacillus shirakamiensis TaxID=1265935 RepID=A0ABS4JJF8_9BACL|nr:stage II sporulation protein R [Paenibacillus shirakamiensis]MBP2001834.1 stage II sporulation protein R [Paenibacillus shirakamiensis]